MTILGFLLIQSRLCHPWASVCPLVTWGELGLLGSLRLFPALTCHIPVTLILPHNSLPSLGLCFPILFISLL